MTVTRPDPSSATATRASRVGVSTSSHVAARRSVVRAREPGTGRTGAWRTWRDPRGGRSVSGRSDDEGEVADLALDPDHGRAGPLREPDLLGERRRAAAAQLPHGSRGVEETPGLRGIRLERLESRARIREAPAESREVVELAGREEEAREIRRRAFEAARDAFSDAWRLARSRRT